MAEQPEQQHVEDEDVSDVPGYKPPAQKTMNEILQQDQDDESLRKYKEALLGADPAKVIVFPEDPRHVVVQKLALVVEGRPDVELDLTGVKSGKSGKRGGAENLKKKPFILKEGCQYRVKIYFYVQREIVTGLKYLQKSYRAGSIPVDKTSFMVGSYPPKSEVHTYTTPLEDAPAGMISRGTYTIKSTFTDDDKNEHVKWEWCLEIKKDWD